MADRITEILEGHIKLAQRQLDLVRAGVDFSWVEKDSGVALFPITKEALLAHIGQLQEALARHTERNLNA